MSATCTLGTTEYAIGRLNAVQQLHVSRRVAPVLATLGLSLGPEVLKKIREASAPGELKGVINVDSILGTIGPLAQVLSIMSDEHVDYVIATCLSVVTRKQPKMGARGADLWSPVMANGNLMFTDIDMVGMVRICIAVMMHNLGDFWKELPEPPASPSS
ncbi:hypothetical protein D3C87_795850 [compost metagenome]